MAKSQPTMLPNQTDNNIPNPASADVQPASEVLQTKTEAPKENATSVFMNSEPMREEQVQNAVKFLSHPRVRGSPVIYRRSFLEKKGLTKEEIDEAFRLVPDPPPSVSNTQPAISDQGGQLKSSSNIHSQVPAQNVQPAAAAASAVAISKTAMFSRFHWSHALLAVGLLAVSGAGAAIYVKKSIIPRFKSWIHKVVFEDEEEESLVKGKKLKPRLAEEAAAAAQAAAAAAADVARASQEMLISKVEEKRCFEELTSLLNVQVREMKSMSNSIQKLGKSNSSGKTYLVEQEDRELAITSSRVSQQSYANGKSDSDLRLEKSWSPPASAETSTGPPHPKSYMEIMAMVQRGERPPNIREINDQPPNPDQPISNPLLAPRPKPWEVGQPQNGSATNLQYQEISDDFGSKIQGHLGSINQLNGDSSVPWWQRKNVRITEIETEDEQKTGYYNGLTNERPVQRSWVPPQPPPVAMPEAAAAMRQPKKSSFQKGQLTDDQLLRRSTDMADDLQRITKISESGGVVESNGGNSELNTSEIQKEENSYLEA